jgi:DNA polymerase-1
METTKAFARIHGYVETLWGRRCYVGGIGASNPTLRQASERQAINAPLQGTAADLIKRAMIRVHDFLVREKTPLRMLLQIHDELLFEGPEDEITRLAPRICSLMGTVASLDVPLEVAWGMGPTWEDAH